MTVSAWLAFGFTFSEVAGFTCEVQQQGEPWGTDAVTADDFQRSFNSETIGAQSASGGVAGAGGISVSGSLDVAKRANRPTAALPT